MKTEDLICIMLSYKLVISRFPRANKQLKKINKSLVLKNISEIVIDSIFILDLNNKVILYMSSSELVCPFSTYTYERY